MILRSTGLLVFGLLVCVSAGCDGSSEGTGGTTGSTGSYGSSGAPTNATTSAASTSTGDNTAAWEAVTRAMEAAAANGGATDMGLVVFDAQDRRVYSHMFGSFADDTRVAVASASKMVSGIVLFDVIREGLLTLDSTTGEVLGWTGPHAAITLRHLLSFTSGLASSDPCTYNGQITLEACVGIIEQKAPEASPGV